MKKNSVKWLLESDEIDLEKLEDSKYLLDILIQLENVLDANDVYCFSNWFDGEIVRGPIVRRHWVSFSLLYPLKKMPDPKAALRLLKIGVQCEFSKIKKQTDGKIPDEDKEPEEPTHWLVTVTVPRRLLEQTEEADLEAYDDDINADDVEQAQDTGMDNDTSFNKDEQASDMDVQGGMPNEQPPQEIEQPRGQ